jgi:hypothetical protein
MVKEVEFINQCVYFIYLFIYDNLKFDFNINNINI